MAIEFFCEGIPKPGGSKRGFHIPKLNRVVIVEDCKKNADWRSAVVAGCRQVYQGEPLIVPLEVVFAFTFLRPKSHYGSGKNAHRLKDGAAAFPAGKPDTTKLIRSTEDALTGILWRDDSQIVSQTATKRYGARAGCWITVGAVRI